MVDPYDRTGKAALSDRVAFAHVVAVHRAFVTALGASERYGLPSSNAALGGVLNDEWVREAGTVFRDSFLMNGRNLIAFYTTERDPKGGPKALDTDVLLDDFDLPKPKNAATLVGFKGLDLIARCSHHRLAGPEFLERQPAAEKRVDRLGHPHEDLR